MGKCNSALFSRKCARHAIILPKAARFLGRQVGHSTVADGRAGLRVCGRGRLGKAHLTEDGSVKGWQTFGGVCFRSVEPRMFRVRRL